MLHSSVTVQARPHAPRTLDPNPRRQAFLQAMTNDLDTAAALTILSNFAADIRDVAQAGQSVHAAQEALRMMGRLFGVRLDDGGPEAALVSGWNQHLARALPQGPMLLAVRLVISTRQGDSSWGERCPFPTMAGDHYTVAAWPSRPASKAAVKGRWMA
jgi:DALR domain